MMCWLSRSVQKPHHISQNVLMHCALLCQGKQWPTILENVEEAVLRHPQDHNWASLQHSAAYAFSCPAVYSAVNFMRLMDWAHTGAKDT